MPDYGKLVSGGTLAAKYLILPVITGILTYLITSHFEFEKGFNEGKVEGMKAGKDEAYKNFGEDTVRANVAMNRTWEKFRKEREQELQAELDIRKSEFEKHLDEHLTEKYGEKLVAVREEGVNKGRELGYEEALKLGKTQCNNECEKNLNELARYGRLWRRFTEKVNAYVKDRPRKETDMRSRAMAIVEISKVGRKSATGLTQHLDGIVDKIGAALEENDLKRVNELVQALQDTLEAKESAWEKDFMTLTLMPE